MDLKRVFTKILSFSIFDLTSLYSCCRYFPSMICCISLVSAGYSTTVHFVHTSSCRRYIKRKKSIKNNVFQYTIIKEKPEECDGTSNYCTVFWQGTYLLGYIYATVLPSHVSYALLFTDCFIKLLFVNLVLPKISVFYWVFLA